MIFPAWLIFALFAQSDPAELSDRAQEAAAAQHFEQAERLWRQALRVRPDFFPAVFNLGYLNYSTGKYPEAADWFRQAARLNASDFNSHYLLGAVLQKMDQRDSALREWRAALAIQPQNFKLMEIMAVEYEKGAYFADSAAVAKRALALRPDDLNAYLIAIHACQNARDFEPALRFAADAARRFPGSARANFEYGFQLQRIGRIRESFTYLKKAMAQDPEYEEPFFFYGDLLVAQGNDKEAIPYLRQALEARDDYIDARMTLARALMHLEDWVSAEQQLKQAARIDPRRPEPHILLSRVYFRQGDKERAAEEKRISDDLRSKYSGLGESVQGRGFPSQ
jgi:tetratricopeptide (TPR) repeat protein